MPEITTLFNPFKLTGKVVSTQDSSGKTYKLTFRTVLGDGTSSVVYEGFLEQQSSQEQPGNRIVVAIKIAKDAEMSKLVTEEYDDLIAIRNLVQQLIENNVVNSSRINHEYGRSHLLLKATLLTQIDDINLCCFAMPLCGPSLDAFIIRCRDSEYKLTLSHIACTAAQLLSGLYTLQRIGVVHSDVKPHNIFLKYPPDKASGKFSLQVVLGDYGLSVYRGIIGRNSNPVALKRFQTTLTYSAPEGIFKKPTTGVTFDIWSFAVTLVALYLQSNPFGGRYNNKFSELENERRILKNICTLIGEPPHEYLSEINTNIPDNLKYFFYFCPAENKFKLIPTEHTCDQENNKTLLELLRERDDTSECLILKSFIDFIMSILQYDDLQRPDILSLLHHPFIEPTARRLGIIIDPALAASQSTVSDAPAAAAASAAAPTAPRRCEHNLYPGLGRRNLSPVDPQPDIGGAAKRRRIENSPRG